MLAGAAAGFGREGAVGRTSGVVAENAVASRLARARADLSAVRANERGFDLAVDAGTYISVESASKPVARMMTDLLSAIEGWTEAAPNTVLSTGDDGLALGRLHASFDQAWLRVRGGDDRPVNGQAHPGAVSEIRRGAARRGRRGCGSGSLPPAGRRRGAPGAVAV